ncbi:MAG: glycosyltransferase family 39 protein [Elusimicrobia bacterium]|nr:glycosyltransferase family 39 protein [Elusimicrobiota bacterium]
MASKKRQFSTSVKNPAVAAAPPANPFWFQALLWTSLAWMFFVAWSYWKQDTPGISLLAVFTFTPLFPQWSAFVRHLLGFGVWLVPFAGATSAGLLALGGRINVKPLGRLVLGATLGLMMLSYLVLFLGFIQLYKPPVFWAVFGAGAIVALAGIKSTLFPVVRSAARQLRENIKKNYPWAVIMLIIVAALAFVMAFVPEIFYDSMVYHLGTPRWYLLEGGIKAHNVMHSKFPLLMQMLYVLGLGLSGEAAAKLFHWVTGVLLALLCVAWADEEGEVQAGWWGALVFLSMPMTQMNWWTAGVDVGTSLFSLAAFWSWAKSFQDTDHRQNWLVLTGLLGGAVFACKYTGGVIPAVILAAHFGIRAFGDRGIKNALKETTILGLCAFAVALPWLIKNLIHTGNPFYPFLGGLLGGEGYDAQKMSHFRGENRGLPVNNLWEALALPWILTFNNLSSLSHLGPLPLALMPVAFVAALRRELPRWIRYVFSAALIGMVIMLTLNRLTRYSMPFLAPIALALAWSLARAWSRQRYFFQAAAIGAIFIMYSSNMLNALGILHSSHRPWSVLMGLESPREYLSYTHAGQNPYPATAGYDFAKEVLPPGSKLLILGDEKTSTCEVPFRSAGVFDIGLPAIWSREAKSADDLAKRFQREGITHILVNLSEGRRISGYGIFNWPDEALALFCDFWDSRVRLLKEIPIPEKLYTGKPPIFLYNIASEEEAGRTLPPWNSVFFIIEELKAPSNTPTALADKKAWLAPLKEKFPQVKAFGNRWFELEQVERSFAAQAACDNAQNKSRCLEQVEHKMLLRGKNK